MENKKINACILLESKAGNRYFYDRQKKTSHLVHPILYYLLKLEQEGEDLKSWFDKLVDNSVDIPPHGLFPRDKVSYYYRKYLLLKNQGYFGTINQEEKLSMRVTADMIRQTLANVQQVTFEVTDCCNMECSYCGYGPLYGDYDKRENKHMDVQTAKQVLDFFAQRWNSPLNTSHKKNVYCGFYGGEVLLNFPFVREIVQYASQLPLLHNHITFSMTTNGLLLHQYMDFLAQFQFNLLISLDGEDIHNAYRLLKNGKPAYPEIIKNIDLLASSYPDYFKERVNFNAVLHNKNSVSAIFHFFKERFNKIPSIGPLNTSGIKETQKKTFWEMYANPDESLYKSNDYQLIEQEMFIRLPHLQNVSTFLHRTHEAVVSDYTDLLFPQLKTRMLPTGTCIPFSKKVFVTVNGKLMPCERIGQQFPFGWASPEGIQLDEERVADQFNEYIQRIQAQCSRCYNTEFCTQCIFNMNLHLPELSCNGFMEYNRYSQYLASYYDFLEKKPAFYSKLLQEVVIEN